jgi:hypothetical protein
MAFDEILAERIAVMLDSRGIEYGRKPMFGGLAFMIGGKMSICVVKDEIVVRCLPDKFEALLEEPFVRQMDFTGRPMRDFAYVEPAGFESDALLDHWVEIAVEFGKLGIVKSKKAM